MFEAPPPRPSLFKRWLRAWRRRVIIALLAFATFYAILAVRFYSKHPKITRNFAAEFNKKIEAVPESDRALPVYLEALKVHQRLYQVAPHVYDRYRDIGPGHEYWPDAVSYVEAHRETLDLVRDGAARASFGWILTDGISAEVAQANSVDPEPATPNPPVLDWKLAHLGPVRQFARQLFLDCRVAIAANDGQRVEADIATMLSLGDQVREHPIMISDLVSLAIYSLAFQAIETALVEKPGLLQDIQLQRIDGRVAKIANGTLELRLDGERAFIADTLQRCFSDDGRGDGEMTADGLRQLGSVAGRKPELDWATAVAAPFCFKQWPSRKEAGEDAELLIRQFEAELQVPAWKRMRWSIESTKPRHRLNFATPLAQALIKGARSVERTQQEQDVTRMVIALERYRIATRRFPERLEELMPAYLVAVPIDRYDGTPVKYRRVDGKPLLYCSGADGDNDGGVPPRGHDGNLKAAVFYTLSDRSRAPDGDWIAWPPPPPEPEEEPEGE